MIFMKITKKYYEWNGKKVKRESETQINILENILDSIENGKDISFNGTIFLSNENTHYKEDCRTMLTEIQQNLEKWLTPNYFRLHDSNFFPEEVFKERCQNSLIHHSYYVEWVKRLCETI